MSVLVAVKISGDTEAFQKGLVNRAEEFESIAARARQNGAVHHRFGVGDGFVLVIDEWETAEAFQEFFSDPKMQEFIGSVGGDPAPPDVTVTEAVSSPDEF
jgi:hypothetical protein